MSEPASQRGSDVTILVHIKHFLQKVPGLSSLFVVPDFQEFKLCLQCHRPISSRFRFCDQACEIEYAKEFKRVYKDFETDSEKIPLCSFPECFKECYVENYGLVRNYCNRSHAREHKEMLERQQSSWGIGRICGQGHQQATGGTDYQPTSAYNTRSASRYSDTIHFYNRNEPYYEFTNFFTGAEIKLDGVLWPTTEHYFQAQKFVGTPIVEKIRNSPFPRDAFSLSRDPVVSPWRRSDWEDVKMDVMRKALYAKFTQHPKLKQMLIRTGILTLIERSPYDSFWGDGGDGTGQNHLGKLLMELRKKLRGGDTERDGIRQEKIFDSHDTPITTPGKDNDHHASKGTEGLLPSKNEENEKNIDNMEIDETPNLISFDGDTTRTQPPAQLQENPMEH